MFVLAQLKPGCTVKKNCRKKRPCPGVRYDGFRQSLRIKLAVRQNIVNMQTVFVYTYFWRGVFPIRPGHPGPWTQIKKRGLRPPGWFISDARAVEYVWNRWTYWRVARHRKSIDGKPVPCGKRGYHCVCHRRQHHRGLYLFFYVSSSLTRRPRPSAHSVRVGRHWQVVDSACVCVSCIRPSWYCPEQTRIRPHPSCFARN